MDRSEFAYIRSSFGKTQKELARLLCVSHKAIQSFEEGWRNIPTYIERELLIILALKTIVEGIPSPCWEIKNCPDEWRKRCIIWEYKIRHFCWLVNGTFCQGEFQESWKKKIDICRQCEVFKTQVPTSI